MEEERAVERFTPKLGKGIPDDELGIAEDESSHRREVEGLRRTLYWIDVDRLIETGEYRRLPEWEGY